MVYRRYRFAAIGVTSRRNRFVAAMPSFCRQLIADPTDCIIVIKSEPRLDRCDQLFLRYILIGES